MVKINIANDETLVTLCLLIGCNMWYTISLLTYANYKCLILTQDFRDNFQSIANSESGEVQKKSPYEEIDKSRKYDIPQERVGFCLFF